MMRDGWDALDAIGREPAPDPDAPGEQDVIDKLHVDVLGTPLGRRLLAYWKRRYLDEPVCAPGDGADLAFHREGQNSVIREAIRRVQRGMVPKA
jgi:hypothetical protein